MDWTLPATLEALLLVLGAAFAVLWLGLSRTGPSGARARRMAWMGCACCVGLLLARAWVVEPFHVPSGSMAPTLLEGDVLLVEKYPYRLSWPIGEGRMLDMGSPRRGDVVVFSLPADPDTRYVKRVIGVAGDDVVLLDGVWHVNARPTHVAPGAAFADTRAGPESVGRSIHANVLGTRAFGTLDAGDQGPFAAHWAVPPGHVFVLGDNRGLSQDSRDFGPVPVGALAGRVERVLFNARGQDRWMAPVSAPPGSRAADNLNQSSFLYPPPRAAMGLPSCTFVAMLAP